MSGKMTHTPRRGPHGPAAGQITGEKVKDFKGSLKKLGSYLAPFKIKILVVVLFAALSTVFTIVGPKILAKATDELTAGLMRIITGAAEGIDFGYIGAVLLFLVGLYGISALFSYIQGFTMAGVSAKVSYNMRTAIMQKINRLPVSFFHKTSQGDVLSRITNDVDTLSQSLSQSITQLITSVCSLIGVLIMMLSISWQLTLVALCTVPVTLLFAGGVVKASQKYFIGQQNYLGSVNGHVEEMYSGHVVVKAFGGEARSLEKFDAENEKLYNAGWKSEFLSGLMQPIMSFIGNLGYVVVCILGASMAAGGTMTVGGIQAFIQYLRSFTQPITQLASISNQIQRTLAAAERIFEFLDEEEIEEKTPKYKIDDCSIRGDIRFDHVTFGYEGSEEIVIHDFSADVKAGQKIAIVGPTGAGKTTMVKLLMRFHDLRGGAIYLDGKNIADFERSDLRREFGMVLQDTWLYSGTIRENIRYGRLDATDEEVLAAARAAQVDRFVRTLPDGYDTILNEEATNVSQGQKQLLTIARAALRQPDHDPRRGDELGRHAHGAFNPDRDGQSDARAHELHHRAPALDDPQRGPDPLHEGRRHRRAGHARRADGEKRLLRRALQQPVCGRRRGGRLTGFCTGRIQTVENRKAWAPCGVPRFFVCLCLFGDDLCRGGAGSGL